MPLEGSGKKQFFIPYNDKIADITHADTLTHTLDLATALSETRKIISVGVTSLRVTGTGAIRVWPNEGVYGSDLNLSRQYPTQIIIKDGTNRLKYNLSVADDDFELYCFGYVVEA